MIDINKREQRRPVVIALAVIMIVAGLVLTLVCEDKMRMLALALAGVPALVGCADKDIMLPCEKGFRQWLLKLRLSLWIMLSAGFLTFFVAPQGHLFTVSRLCVYVFISVLMGSFVYVEAVWEKEKQDIRNQGHSASEE